jgi:hypothetical protein
LRHVIADGGLSGTTTPIFSAFGLFITGFIRDIFLFSKMGIWVLFVSKMGLLVLYY